MRNDIMNIDILPPASRLIRIKEVLAVTGLSRSSLYKQISEGRFPTSVSLGERSVAWIESEVQGWIGDKISIRDNAIN
ncbi:AlpA family transcriptional regulator [Photobacterium gaetbulicola]|uniref:helix-turn-helix transcriptional regulator n=1 Tax=Photobacterium gaetbulicola TaxID=1295392 RepID=UPI0005CB9FAE|nr:AlpA family transcriptional regulator [Photobacterium gaetbulicola]PSU12309.1 AlpA family transcriptional regulator [Photobacterium gaetbulicola]